VLSVMCLLGHMAADHPGSAFHAKTTEMVCSPEAGSQATQIQGFHIPHSVSPDMEHWGNPLSLLKGVPLAGVTSYMVVFTDAGGGRRASPAPSGRSGQSRLSLT